MHGTWHLLPPPFPPRGGGGGERLWVIDVDQGLRKSRANFCASFASWNGLKSAADHVREMIGQKLQQSWCLIPMLIKNYSDFPERGVISDQVMSFSQTSAYHFLVFFVHEAHSCKNLALHLFLQDWSHVKKWIRAGASQPCNRKCTSLTALLCRYEVQLP